MRDTVETAITWDRFKDLHANVKAAGLKAIREVTGRNGSMTCRFTHVYPDGPRRTLPGTRSARRRNCPSSSRRFGRSHRMQ